MNNSRSELERSALEMIRVARRFLKMRKVDLFQAGTYRVTHRRLAQIEKQLRAKKRRGLSPKQVQEIAKELADLVGNLCKSLIRCIQLFPKRMCCLCI